MGLDTVWARSLKKIKPMLFVGIFFMYFHIFVCFLKVILLYVHFIAGHWMMAEYLRAVIVKINVDKMLRSLMVPRPPLRHFQDFVNGVAVGWDAEPAVGSHGKSGTNTKPNHLKIG